MKNILSILITLFSLTANATIFGFNQTHMMNTLTDNKCVIIWENVQRIITEIPEERRQVIRWPGGTEANFYNCEMWGYSVQEEDSKWGRNSVNALSSFIDVSMMVKWEVIPVLNLYEEYLNPDLTAERERQNMLLIERIFKAGIKIPYIELGNELNIWVDKSKLKNSDYNRDKANYDREIKRYYDISLKYYKLIKAKYPNIKIAAVYCDNRNARDKAWQAVFKKGPWEGLVIHHYEESNNEKDWVTNLTRMKKHCTDAKKEMLLTEWAWKLGPSITSAAYRKNASSPLLEKYNTISWDIISKLKIEVACFHRINGIGSHKYNYLQF